MPLASRLHSPAALYRKLEREAYRAYHASTPLAKSDHFYNFCVTASSMRDYCHEQAGRTNKDQRKVDEGLWWANPLLAATFEVANSTKHFVLRDVKTGIQRPPKTKSVRLGPSKFADIYVNNEGKYHAVLVERTEVRVTLSDGKRYELYKFSDEVLSYWWNYLKLSGNTIRQQSASQLAKSAA